MTTAPPHPGSPRISWRAHRLPWLLLIAAAVFTLDRMVKQWVVAHVPYGGAIPFIPHVLRISHWTNDGAAFSMFADSASPHLVNHLLIAFNFVIAAFILAALVYLGNRINLVTVALALILGGAMGNVHDRIAYGSVIDFIELHRIFNYQYPDFNIADSAVVVGACLLLLNSFLPDRSRRLASPPSDPAAGHHPAAPRGAQ